MPEGRQHAALLHDLLTAELAAAVGRAHAATPLEQQQAWHMEAMLRAGAAALGERLARW